MTLENIVNCNYCKNQFEFETSFSKCNRCQSHEEVLIVKYQKIVFTRICGACYRKETKCAICSGLPTAKL